MQPRYDKRIAYPALNIPHFEKCQFSTLGRSANVYVIYKGNIPATAVQLPLLFHLKNFCKVKTNTLKFSLANRKKSCRVITTGQDLSSGNLKIHKFVHTPSWAACVLFLKIIWTDDKTALVRRVFGDDVPFPHEADIALCGALFDVQDLLQLLAKVYVGDMCLPPEDVTCDIHQFLFLCVSPFPHGFSPLYTCIPASLSHAKSISGTSSGLPSLTFRAFTTDWAGSSSFSIERIVAAFTLQLAAQMSPQFQTVRDEVQHTKNTRVVDARQPIKFIYHRHAFRFIVGTLNKVGDAVNDDQLDAAVLVVELIHALHNGVQAFFAWHTRQTERFQFIGFVRLFGTCQQVAYILEQLHFRLFGIIEQDLLFACRWRLSVCPAYLLPHQPGRCSPPRLRLHNCSFPFPRPRWCRTGCLVSPNGTSPAEIISCALAGGLLKSISHDFSIINVSLYRLSKIR